MIELLLESLMLIARWDVAIALLIGAIGGVIIGAIPGVGPAVAIAILPGAENRAGHCHLPTARVLSVGSLVYWH